MKATDTVTPACPGTVFPVEVAKVIDGTLYPRYEYCSRCGKVYPG